VGSSNPLALTVGAVDLSERGSLSVLEGCLLLLESDVFGVVCWLGIADICLGVELELWSFKDRARTRINATVRAAKRATRF
jgi:hypothetical protein